MNLVAHFCRICGAKRGGLTAALAALNLEQGSNHKLARLGAWRRGSLPVPAPVQAYMRRIVLADIREHNPGRFTVAVLGQILEACEPPTAAVRIKVHRSFYGGPRPLDMPEA